MERILLCAALFVFFYKASAQTQQRRIGFATIDKDSVVLHLNDEYYLIEDSCAQIIRYSRLHIRERKFYGKFKDVSKANPGLVVSEGTYSADGIKDGMFITRYLNGNLQAKGNFKDNKYDGKWEMYYEDGKPELDFEVIDGDCHITDAWKPDGKKIVGNGNGLYEDDLGGMYWKGKLVNGKPDGKWTLARTDDASGSAISTENFKKGKFRDGSTGNFDYTDVSHIALVNPLKLPFINAERMFISPVPCNGTKRKHIVGAQYKEGLRFFTNHISEAVSSYLSSLNLNDYNRTVEIEGEVSDKGDIINLKNNNSSSEGLVRGIILKLKTLPPLEPATVDGKPVKQKFTISFHIANGMYEFSYRFLPIKTD